MSEPLVLLPGMMADARLYWHQIVTFGRGRSVQVAPLTGQSVEDMARAALDAAPARFAVVGQGLGGNVALEMLRRAPERIARIGLISVSPLGETPQEAAMREVRVVKARAGRLAQALAEDLPEASLAPGETQAEVHDLARAMAEALGPEVYVAQSRAMQRRPDQQKTLRTAAVPGLILGGVHDRLVPVRRHEFMAALMPAARLVMLPDAGHLPTLEAPGRVTRILGQWLG